MESVVSLKKGQASIELILLLAVVLLLVVTIILPSFQITEKAAVDTSSIVIAKSQAQKIVNAIELVDSSPVGAKQTIHFMVPARSYIYCSNQPREPQFTEVRFSFYPLLEVPEACKHPVILQNGCVGIIRPKISVNSFSCVSNNITKRLDLDTAGFFTAEISKNSAGIIVVFNG